MAHNERLRALGLFSLVEEEDKGELSSNPKVTSRMMSVLMDPKVLATSR